MKSHDQIRPVAYVSFVTFMSALDHLRAASLGAALGPEDCGVRSESNWSQLSRSLRFFELIDEDNVPTESLKSLVRATDRKLILRKLLRRHYPRLFAADLSSVSLTKFTKLLAGYDVSGASLRRARSFFLGAARYSGVPLSKEIARVIRHRVSKRSRSSKTRHKQSVSRPFGRATSKNEIVSLNATDFNLSLSFPRSFAELGRDERDRLYRLLDDLLLFKRREAQRAAASLGQENDQMADVDALSKDSDEAVH